MIIIILSSCSNPDRGELYKVGMITEKPKNASAWEIKGYEGLERIKETYPDVDVLYETNIQTEEEAVDVIDQFAKKKGLIYFLGIVVILKNILLILHPTIQMFILFILMAGIQVTMYQA